MSSPMTESGAKFYAEHLGIPLELAEKIADFMTLASESPFVLSFTALAKAGHARVYFEPWSQNSLMTYHLADRWFYDAKEDDVFAEGFFYGAKHSKKLDHLVLVSTGNFSGAKTKARLKEFCEAFYGKKTARN